MMMKKQLIALALAGMSVMSIAAQAEEVPDNRWYVAPFGSFVKSGDRGTDDGWGAGYAVGKMLDQHFNVELRGFYQELNKFSNITPGYARAGGDWKMAGGTADLQYYFFRDKLSPYAVIAGGAMNNWVPGDSGISAIGEAGAGLTYELMDNLLLRGDVRYRYTNDLGANLHSTNNNHHDMIVNVGVVVPFGEKPKAAVVPDVTPPPVPKADCSTLDSDNDGVNDCVDKCPGSAAGSKVDTVGCLMMELKGVQFKVNSAILTTNAKAILDGVAKDLIAFSQNKAIEVQGHTSSEASDTYNLKLSQRRAEAVVKYLKAHGVKDSLVAKGFGETQLKVTPDNTEALRSVNRRVELHWLAN